MSKPVLGRKLGGLLKAEADKNVNPTLLRGSQPSLSKPPPPSAPSIPTWYWLGADLLLVGFALLLVYQNPGPLSPSKRAMAVGALVLGGGLALWALRPAQGK